MFNLTRNFIRVGHRKPVEKSGCCTRRETTSTGRGVKPLRGASVAIGSLRREITRLSLDNGVLEEPNEGGNASASPRVLTGLQA